MELRVIGCHGGETPKHRTSAFVINDRIAIDAVSLTSGLELKAQNALEAVLVSHAHLDHVRDLATIADDRLPRATQDVAAQATPGQRGTDVSQGLGMVDRGEDQCQIRPLATDGCQRT